MFPHIHGHDEGALRAAAEQLRQSRCGWLGGHRGWGGHFGHGHHRHAPGHPSAPPGVEDPTDFDVFEEAGEGMRGGDHGERGGPRGRGGEGFGFGWGFGDPRGRGHGHRPAGRPLESGDLRWLALDLIATQPRHGYDIIRAIADALHGNYTPSPGVIYPTLTLLEETGLIAGEAMGSKKLYSLTEEGKAELEAHAADIRAARARLAEAGSRFGGAPAPELIRAMTNLRAALQVRMGKGELSAEALGKITAALDRAAAEIERS